MDRLYFEVPGLSREEDAVAYIREFHEHGSAVNGTGGLDRYLGDYGAWLEKLARDRTRVPDEERVPARTFFLVRESDRRIVGMINIRLCLNERLRRFGGHIGFSIRPTERGKGYNKINLYLGLKVCDAHGIGTVLMDADLSNPASWKTMEAMGGVRIREYEDDTFAHCTVVDYTIDVKKALTGHAQYEQLICHGAEEDASMVRLVPVTEDNWLELASLSVMDSQKGFVAPSVGILARGYVYRGCGARIYAFEADGVMVGMALVREFTDEPLGYDLQQFMVDQRYQHKGYGSRALELVLDELRKEGRYDHVELCVKKNDAEAIRLYAKHGFADSGYIDEDLPDSLNMICRLTNRDP